MASARKVLWMRGVTRLQHQIRVVNAFRSGVSMEQGNRNIVSPAFINSLLAPVVQGSSPVVPDETDSGVNVDEA